MDNKIYMIYDKMKDEYLKRVSSDKINEGEFKIIENNIILNKEYENCYHNLELIIKEKYNNFIIPINNIKKRYEREVINFDK